MSTGFLSSFKLEKFVDHFIEGPKFKEYIKDKINACLQYFTAAFGLKNWFDFDMIYILIANKDNFVCSLKVKVLKSLVC